MSINIKTIVNNYQRLPIAELDSNQPYQTHENSKEEADQREFAKRDFLSAKSVDKWPAIDFPRLDTTELMAYRSMLLGMIDDIEYAPEDTSHVSQDTIYDSLMQKLHEVNRHILVVHMLGKKSRAEWLKGTSAAELRRRAAEQNLEIFGRPDPARFNWFLAGDRELARQALAGDDDKLRDIAEEFLNRTGDVDGYDETAPVELDAKTREQFKHDLFAIFPGLKEFGENLPDEIEVADSLPYFDKMRDIMGLSADKYRAYFTDKRACEETEYGVSVGLRREKPFVRRDMIRLAFHEWLHVFRRDNALRQNDPAKRLPTPANLAYEEAFCVLAERTLVDEQYVSGVNYYKSVGLQMNLDKTQDNHNLRHMRNFRDVLDIMTLGEQLESGKTDAKSRQTIRSRLYNQIMRTTRGTVLDARDLSYHIGDQRAKQSIDGIKDLSAHERQEHIKWYLSAQFDPTDEGDSRVFAA